MIDETFDLIVVGGGIHGAGVAQAGAAAGQRVLVLERTALAAGTSSRSSKLVHGGLRYLESGQVSLVRESLRERRRLLRLAPDLVRLRPFHLPVYRSTRRAPWQIRAGLSLYALLGGLREGCGFETVPRRQWGDLEGLRTDGLRAVFQFFDGQTDDTMLTRAVMRSACDLGAELCVPARFVRATLGGERCTVTYAHRGSERTCTATAMVNAAGPWANLVLDAIEPAPPRQAIELVQGAHIEVEGVVERGVYYVEAPQDGRAVFVMPWHGRTLVGTTETPYSGNPDGCGPLEEERRYLATVLEHYFPRYAAALARRNGAAWAGLRVLPAGSGRPFDRPRETILQVDRPRQPRLVTIYGGKLTTYRTTAAKVMGLLSATLPRRARRADTATLRLGAPEATWPSS